MAELDWEVALIMGLSALLLGMSALTVAVMALVARLIASTWSVDLEEGGVVAAWGRPADLSDEEFAARLRIRDDRAAP